MIVVDSRGRELQTVLNNLYANIAWTVSVNSAKGFKELVEIAHSKFDPCRYKMVVIMGGICDVTERSNRRRMISVRQGDYRSIVSRMMEGAELGLLRLRALNPNLLLATSYGVDLKVYNDQVYGSYSNSNHKRDQTKIALTIDLFNNTIAGINAQHGMPTIRLGNVVHHVRPHSPITSSYKMLRDGCHPGDRLRLLQAIATGRTCKRILNRIDKH